MFGSNKWLKILAVSFLVIICGCIEFRKAAYHLGAGAIGAGAGYLYDGTPESMVIGGTAASFAGGMLYNSQVNQEEQEYKKGYQAGYQQAQVNIADDYWQENTGKKDCSQSQDKFYWRIKVGQEPVNGVVYQPHYQTVEVLR